MKSILVKLGIYDRTSFIQFVIQLIKFGLVGLSNTAVSLAIYYLLVYLDIHYILANLAGFVVSVLNSFYWNRKYVFKSSGNIASSLVKTFISYGFTFVLGSLLLFIMVDLVEISAYIAPILNLLVTIPLNYMMNRFWAFRK